MPKRPCSIQITPDESKILCADKFGDVYSLPLVEDSVEQASLQDLHQEKASDRWASTNVYKPTATSLTVHTGRNKKALENQLRLTDQPAQKERPSFQYDLLLGHVSLLTDIQFVELQSCGDTTNLKPRGYIITADRDEHIRISRGPPQSYIIEGFCQGHEDYVSRLLVPKGQSEVLISGSGSGHIYTWNWLNGKLLHKFDIKNLTEDILVDEDNKSEEAEGSRLPLAEVPTFPVTVLRDLPHKQIAVLCEG